MSLPQVQQLTCPHCKQSTEVTFWSSVNVTLEPQLKEKLLAGELFAQKCPNCGEVARLDYPMLYHDMEKKLLIFYVRDDKGRADAIEVFNNDKNMLASPEEYEKRIVGSINQLREKILLADAGLDDRIMEFVKLVYIKSLQSQQPAIEAAQVLYTDTEPPMIAFITPEGNCVSSEFEKGLYDEVAEKSLPLIEKYGVPDYQVNSRWLMNLINSEEK